MPEKEDKGTVFEDIYFISNDLKQQSTRQLKPYTLFIMTLKSDAIITMGIIQFFWMIFM